LNVGAQTEGVPSFCGAPNSFGLSDLLLPSELWSLKWPSISWQNPARFASWRHDTVVFIMGHEPVLIIARQEGVFTMGGNVEAQVPQALSPRTVLFALLDKNHISR